MATTYHKFTGKCAWAHILGLNKFKKNSIQFYPDDKTRKEIKALGTRLGIKEDDGEKSGLEGFYYTFTRDPEKSFGKPLVVVDAEGKPWDSNKLIGNGSTVEAEISVYPFNHPEYGQGLGHRLMSVRILEYIPYVRPTEVVAQPDDEKPVEIPVEEEAPKKKRKNPF